MLPESHLEGDVFAVPKFELESQDVEGFMEQLRGFHSEFRGCFERSEPREQFFHYMVGQLSKVERKSVEPIAVAVEGGTVRGMQRCLSDVTWDEGKMLTRYRGMVAEDMGDEAGVLCFDETGFPKKGKDSVGVARQYCGTLGKVDNCQVGVFCAYASRHGYALLDKRLFLPEAWFGEEYKERREKCRVPEETTFKTKPQLAVEMFEKIKQEGSIPFRYVVGDTVYGDRPEFIEAVETANRVYFLAVASDTRCFLSEPKVVEREYQYKGKKNSRLALAQGEPKPVRVDELAGKINDYFWYRRKVSEGAQGPIEYEFTKREVVLSKNGLPGRRVWLVMKRTLGGNPTYSYYISNAPASTRLKTFVWLSGMRWAIEQCFEETKTELGMDQYELRKYPGWQHHILSCMLAHFFLWHLRIKLGKKSSIHYAVAA